MTFYLTLVMPLHEPEVILDKLDLHLVLCHFSPEQETDFKTQSLQRKQFKDANCEAGFLDNGSLLL